MTFYLLDLTRGRYDLPRLLETARALAERHKPDVILIEDASTGSALAQDLRQAHGLPVKLAPVERDKESRPYVHQAKFEAGLVHFSRKAPFTARSASRVAGIPSGKDRRSGRQHQSGSVSQERLWVDQESLEGFAHFTRD